MTNTPPQPKSEQAALKQLRSRLRAERRQLTPRQISDASEAVALHASRNLWLRCRRSFAIYEPFGGEIDPEPLRAILDDEARGFCYPMLNGKRLRFGNGGHWRTNRLGISEPDLACAMLTPLSALQVIFTPLVAFDSSGNRLGMGGGFYDRTLAGRHKRNGNTTSRPKLIGLAHDFQEVPDLPKQPWDVPLHGVITPAGLRWFR